MKILLSSILLFMPSLEGSMWLTFTIRTIGACFLSLSFVVQKLGSKEFAVSLLIVLIGTVLVIAPFGIVGAIFSETKKGWLLTIFFTMLILPYYTKNVLIHFIGKIIEVLERESNEWKKRFEEKNTLLNEANTTIAKLKRSLSDKDAALEKLKVYDVKYFLLNDCLEVGLFFDNKEIFKKHDYQVRKLKEAVNTKKDTKNQNRTFVETKSLLSVSKLNKPVAEYRFVDGNFIVS